MGCHSLRRVDVWWMVDAFLFQLWMGSIVFEVNKSFMSCPPSKISCPQMVQPTMRSLVIGSWIGRIFSEPDTTSNGFQECKKWVGFWFFCIILKSKRPPSTTQVFLDGAQLWGILSQQAWLPGHNGEMWRDSPNLKTVQSQVIVFGTSLYHFTGQDAYFGLQNRSKMWPLLQDFSKPLLIWHHWMALTLRNQLGQQWSHPSNWSGARQILSMGLKPMSLASADPGDLFPTKTRSNHLTLRSKIE